MSGLKSNQLDHQNALLSRNKRKLDKYYRAYAPSDYTVKYWFREFYGFRKLHCR